MPKQVERIVFTKLKHLNEWLGLDGKNYRVISIEEGSRTSFLTVFVERDASNEEWYLTHRDLAVVP